MSSLVDARHGFRQPLQGTMNGEAAPLQSLVHLALSEVAPFASAASSTSVTSISEGAPLSDDPFSIRHLVPSDALADYAIVESVKDDGPSSKPVSFKPRPADTI